ncbi:MAG: hypothetical protein PSV46_23370 [Reyranella sp.]|nr:hypothetical protein [Reyranella sp.]
MRRLAGLVAGFVAGLVMALVGIGVLGGCSTDPYAPYDFKRVPGYTPPGGISSPARVTTLRLESQR